MNEYLQTQRKKIGDYHTLFSFGYRPKNTDLETVLKERAVVKAEKDTSNQVLFMRNGYLLDIFELNAPPDEEIPELELPGYCYYLHVVILDKNEGVVNARFEEFKANAGYTESGFDGELADSWEAFVTSSIAIYERLTNASGKSHIL